MAIIALLLSREQAAPLAYIGGLIGADLLNLGSAAGWALRWPRSAEPELSMAFF
jgi:uncharacterized membrane protein